MNNNNEKTFADLFLNSKDDSEIKDDNVTFDVFSSDVGSSDNDIKSNEAKDDNNLSFSSFNSMAMGDKFDNESVSNEKFEKDENNIVDNISNLDDIKEEKSLFDIAVGLEDDSKSNEEVVENEELEKSQEVSEENNLFDMAVNLEADSKVSEEVVENKELEKSQEVSEENNLFDMAVNLEADSKVSEEVVENKELDKTQEVSEENSLFDVAVDDEFNRAIEDVNTSKDSFDFENLENNENIDINIASDNLENKLFDKPNEEVIKNDNSDEVVIEKTDSIADEKIVFDSNIFGLGDVNSSSDDNKIEESQNLEEKHGDNVVDNNDVSLTNTNYIEEDMDSNVFGIGQDDVTVKDDVSNAMENEKVEVSDDIESNNPFFGGNGDFVIDGPLFDDVISLDQSNNVAKKVNKLDLSKTKHFGVKVVAKKEPLSKFIIGVISYAFFIWLLLIGITLLVYVLDIKIRAAKGDYNPPVFNAYVVLTGSMLPEIQVNDVVVTKRVEVEQLDVGDIITFASTDSRFAGTIITHRIIKKNPGKNGQDVTFQTKGDNNNVADSALVKPSNIYGKVILKIPKLGYLQEFLATDGGWIIVILIPCLTVISYDIVKLFKGLKRKKYNNIKVKK